MKIPLLCLFFALLCCPLQAAPPERLVIGAEGGKGLAIIDPADGNKVLWHRPLGAVHDLQLLPDFSLLTQDGWSHLIQVDLDKNIVWEYDASLLHRKVGDPKVEVHAFQRLGNGNTLLAESGPGRLLEVTPEKKIVREIPLLVSQPSPHSDTRLVRQLENGHFLVAHEADQIVKEYDASGGVIWEFPVPLFGKAAAAGHGPEAFGGKCFSAIRLHNGNTLISTGNGHSLLEVTSAKEIVWKLEQKDLPGITLAWVTTVEELAKGNLRFGNCHAGPENPQIIEVTKTKEVVWTFQDFTHFGNDLANTLVIDGEQAKILREKLARL